MASAETMASVPEPGSAIETAPPSLRGAIDARLLDELWRASDGPSWALTRDEFDSIVADAGVSQKFGLELGAAPTPRQQADYFRGLRLDDLVLARACAAGNERAWEHFISQHRQPLIRAAIERGASVIATAHAIPEIAGVEFATFEISRGRLAERAHQEEVRRGGRLRSLLGR